MYLSIKLFTIYISIIFHGTLQLSSVLFPISLDITLFSTLFSSFNITLCQLFLSYFQCQHNSLYAIFNVTIWHCQGHQCNITSHAPMYHYSTGTTWWHLTLTGSCSTGDSPCVCVVFWHSCGFHIIVTDRWSGVAICTGCPELCRLWGSSRVIIITSSRIVINSFQHLSWDCPTVSWPLSHWWPDRPLWSIVINKTVQPHKIKSLPSDCRQASCTSVSVWQGNSVG